MAKMNRERAVKEKRARKQEKKEERKAAAAAAGNGEAAENPFPEDPVDEETSRPLSQQDAL
jgi:hypothetical protein